ncbi:MAG: hypothetical protein JJT77_13150 [Crocinitomicaceae bacterium]|nr:hypothetical protein [Crocinitomicaceae bacterium]
MSEKFKGKYRTDTLRLQNWDYGWNGSYFITFCTKNRAHFFGEIEDKEMQLSAIGEIAYALFNEIPDRFPYINIDAMVIMPDHVHGVLTIDKSPLCGGAINRDLS